MVPLLPISWRHPLLADVFFLQELHHNSRPILLHIYLGRLVWLVIRRRKGCASYLISCILLPSSDANLYTLTSVEVWCFAIRPCILFRVLLEMSGRPDSWKIRLLIAPGTFRKFLFTLLRSRIVADFRTFQWERVFLFLMGSCKNHFVVTKWRLIFFATSSNEVDFANSFIIRFFSLSLRSLPRPTIRVIMNDYN